MSPMFNCLQKLNTKSINNGGEGVGGRVLNAGRVLLQIYGSCGEMTATVNGWMVPS